MIYEIGGDFFIDIDRITAISPLYRGEFYFKPNSFCNDESFFYVYCQLHQKPIAIHRSFDKKGVIERRRKNLLIVWEKRMCDKDRL